MPGHSLTRSAVHLLVCALLLSCAAKSKPLPINVAVRADYKGSLHVMPCSNQARSTEADAEGQAFARECPAPGQDVELVVLQGGRTYRISSERLSISRTADGIAVEIIGQVP